MIYILCQLNKALFLFSIFNFGQQVEFWSLFHNWQGILPCSAAKSLLFEKVFTQRA